MKTFLKVPRRVHNALILVTFLGRHVSKAGFVSLSEIAESAHLSQGFLEEVAASLRRGGIIRGRRGAGGGYTLTRPPSDITIGDIIVAIEGEEALADAADRQVGTALSIRCPSWGVWQTVSQQMATTLRGMTLSDMLEDRTVPDMARKTGV